MMSGLINLFVGLSLWGSPVADPVASAVSDFRKVNAVYAGNFSVSMDYHYFQDHTTNTVKESTSGYYLKAGEKSYSKLHNVETVRGSKSTIVADNNASNIVVLDAYKEANKQTITMGLDTLLRNCEKIDMVEGSGTRVYTLHLGRNLSEEFNRISVTINITNYTLSKIVLFYKNPVRSNVDSKEESRAAMPPRVEIVYKNFSANPAANAELFNESHYVSLSGKAYKGAGKYANYTVYNQKLR